ncbi:hypothetical protein N7470_004708 [Penicillium chermesinum]|nr:hypothetical protein N7470_004708 [Penicillium chermesinum]
MAEERPPNNLRQTSRFITDHSENGLAIFHSDTPERVPAQAIPTGDNLHLAYATNQFPVDLSKDLATYQQYLINPPAFTVPGGTLLCTIDLAPGSTSALHRTLSLDYAIVIEGIVELQLDSGEAKTLLQVVFVLQESKPVEIGGEKLKEDFGF